jgi:transcriptional regulator with XRE-family HTH domain
MNIVSFWERTNSLIKQRKTTQRVLSKECGFTERRIETLVSTERLPDAKEAYYIAVALGTTVEYLVTGKDTSGHSQNEQRLITGFRQLSPGNQKDILGNIDKKIEIADEEAKKGLQQQRSGA